MAISEFLEKVECLKCRKMGFENRDKIKEMLCITNDNELRKGNCMVLEM